ncbi:MAG: hypothetical protein IV090_24660 [Candidatus Sericytochromatia bacterium]|nr:hypothetical protein [Candidatus Sericytochromatia bacterium]
MIYLYFPKTEEEFEIDCTEDITPQYASELTQKRVGDGGTITDNRRRQPMTLSLNGFMTNVPLDMTGNYEHDAEGNHTKFRDRLLKAEKEGEYVTVDGGIGRGFWEDLQITNVSIPWNVEVGTGFPFSLNLQGVRKSKSKVKDLFRQSEKFKAVQAKFQEAKDLGKKAAQEATQNVKKTMDNVKKSLSGTTLTDWFRGGPS